MCRFFVGSPEEGIEQAALADITAAEEGDFGEWGRWEGAEVGRAEEEGRWDAGEEGAGVLQFGG